MAQGDKHTAIQGTNSIFAMSRDKIGCILEDRMVTYEQVMVGYRAKKADPNRV